MRAGEGTVYVLTKGVRREDSWVLDVFRSALDACDAARAYAEDCRYEYPIRSWSDRDNDQHIITYECGDVTWAVMEWEPK